ncbi:hypothetical protein pclt_cds_1033 [Pandoravirus celtis]|uniref:Uncharacterized protein n=1 Tax=Pandoravirus celtis TaxID=2568002 RepID=A0A4D6EKD7_9VIRU|nr:hypothetical protein pclt_cds_1033 [Pandoravirus celtis]
MFPSNSIHALPVPQPFGAPQGRREPGTRCAVGYHYDVHRRCVPDASTCRDNGDGTTTCCTTTVNVPPENGRGDAVQRAHALPVAPTVGASWGALGAAAPNHPQCARPGWVYDMRMADCVPAGSVRCYGEPASGQQCCAPTVGNRLRCCDQTLGGVPRCSDLPMRGGGGGDDPGTGQDGGGGGGNGGNPDPEPPGGYGARSMLGSPAVFGASAPSAVSAGPGFNCRPTYSTASGSLTLTCEPQRGSRGEMPGYPQPDSVAFCNQPTYMGGHPLPPGYALHCQFSP